MRAIGRDEMQLDPAPRPGETIPSYAEDRTARKFRLEAEAGQRNGHPERLGPPSRKRRRVFAQHQNAGAAANVAQISGSFRSALSRRLSLHWTSAAAAGPTSLRAPAQRRPPA